MMMIVDLTNVEKRFSKVNETLEKVGQEVGVSVKLQHEEIFNSMHRI